MDNLVELTLPNNDRCPECRDMFTPAPGAKTIAQKTTKGVAETFFIHPWCLKKLLEENRARKDVTGPPEKGKKDKEIAV